MSSNNSNDISLNHCNINRIRLIDSSNCKLDDNKIFNLYQRDCEKSNYNSNKIKKFITNEEEKSLLINTNLNSNNIQKYKYNIKEKNRDIQLLVKWLIPLFIISLMLIPLGIFVNIYSQDHPIVLFFLLVFIGFIVTLGKIAK